MLLSVFTRALHNLMMPAIIRIFLLCLCCYIVSWAALAWVMGLLMSQILGEGAFAGTLGFAAGVGAAWFLFPLLYPILISFFDEKIATIIETEEYPNVTPANPPFWPTFMQDIKFTLKALLYNALCLPFYFIPIIGQCLYYGLNGYLLGMQFFRMSAGRRMAYADAKQLMIKGRKDIFLVGLVVSISATIPVLNFAAPVLGVAAMLHVFYRLQPASVGAEATLLLPEN